MASSHSRARDALRAYALSLPEAWEDHPWGELVIKVGKKIFVFLGLIDDKRLSMSVKLPDSADLALSLPFTAPTGYGLGKAGWVTARFLEHDPPVDMLTEWVVESYRAVATKKLAARLEEAPPIVPKKPAKRTAKKPAKKAAKRTAKKRAR